MKFVSMIKGAPLVVTSLVLAGAAMAADTLKLTVLGTPANKAAYGKVIPAFEAQSGIKVDVEYVGGNYPAVVTTQLQGSNAPDVVQLVPGGSVPHSVLNVAASGRLADLSAASWIDRIPDATLPLVSSEGAVYAWAATVQVSGLIVNEDILAENGLAPPTTLDELYALCGALKKKGDVPGGWTGTPGSRSAGQATTVTGSVGAAAMAGRVDHRRTVDEIYGVGDVVFARWSIEWTHAGPIQGAPPTGRRIRISEAGIMHYDDEGRMKEGWFIADQLELFLQLGGKVKVSVEPEVG